MRQLLMAPNPKFMDKFPLKLSVVQLRLATRLRLAGRVALIAAPVTGALFLAHPAFAKKGLKTDLSSSELAEARQLDWVPIEELTEEQKKNVPDACCGAFIAPVRTDVDMNIDPEKAPMRATADESHSEQQTQMTLSGKVNITQGTRSLIAENAHMDQETRNAELAGGIQLREPGLLVRADKAKMNLDSGDAQLDNARFVLYESRVHGNAERLNKFGDNVVKLDQSTITSCEPGDNSWSVEGSDITLYPDEHFGTIRNMRLNIRDVPVMYMPYARFPLGSERLTGFLFPSVGYSSNRSEMDIAAPFYWNIAPNYDATITPRYISGRGSVFELETRHLSPLFESKFTGSYISKDRGGYDPDLESTIEPDPPRGSERWYYNFEQRGGKGQAWTTNIDYSDISDNNFLRDMNYGSVDSNRQAYLHQTASINYQTLHWSMGARADEYRLLTVNQNPYRELPRVHLNGNYRVDDWVFKINNEYVNFVKNRYYELSADNIIYGERENTDYSVSWDKHYPSGFIKPSVAVKTLTYQLNNENIVNGDS
ncbi:MAG: LPS-assembly protein LptD, partial [Moraxellaceae bacterium]